MPDEDDSSQSEGKAVPTGPASTPLDHPYFLPAILAAMTVWFGYDGFINQDPDMLEHLAFNRGGFAILLPLFLWFAYKGKKEQEQIKARKSEHSGDPPPAP